MNKAYDRIEWDFLRAVLLKMGFAEIWVEKVMNCVSSVEFCVIINGKAGGGFKPSRGIRQGDPISPYLFIIVSDVLFSMLNHAAARGFLKGLSFGRRGLTLTHLFFADDSLLFLKATSQNCRVVSQILKSYCKASGQVVNLEKSNLFFSPNTLAEVKEEMRAALNVNITDDPRKYLGLPTIYGRSEKEALAFVKEKILHKVQGWKQSLLTQAGREVLIKFVAQAVPSYPMSVFSFPIGFCKEIDSILANFWWGHNQEANKIHWIIWKDLGLPKKEGGMGFRSPRDFNTALLAKQCWRLMMEPDAFWAQLIKSRYFPNNDFLEAKKGARSSWAWSSLLAGRDVIANGARWQVLDGSRTKLWTDKWIPCSPDRLLLPKLGVEVNEEEKVETIINPSTCVWNVNAIDRQVNVRDACLIKALPLGDGTEADRMVWPFNRDGSFTVKFGYNLIIQASHNSNTSSPSGSWTIDKSLWKSIWNSKLVPKLKKNLWRICKGCLSTRQALHRRHLGPSPLCPLCGEFPKFEEHLFLLCNWVQGVWFGGPLCYNINRQSITTFGE